MVAGDDDERLKIELRRSNKSELVDLLETAAARYEWLRFGWDTFTAQWYFTTDPPVLTYRSALPVVDLVAPTLTVLVDKLRKAVDA